MWIVSWDPILMKILLNWTTCESRKQCTRPNDRNANALKCNPNSTLVAYSPMKQIKKIFFFFFNCWPQQDFIQYHKTTNTQNKPTWFQYHKTTHTQNKSTGLWIRQHTLIPQFNTIRTNKHPPYKHMRLSFNSLIWYIPQITHLQY